MSELNAIEIKTQPSGVTIAASAPVDSASATGSVGASGTPADGNTVKVGSQTYTFKTALTPADYEVLINGQDGSLTNLEHAINKSGGVPGTDYQVPVANASVTAADVGSHAIALTAITPGVAGNVALVKVGANLSVSGANMTGGIDGTAGRAGDMQFSGGNFYGCTANATIVTAGAWKKFTLGSL